MPILLVIIVLLVVIFGFLVAVETPFMARGTLLSNDLLFITVIVLMESWNLVMTIWMFNFVLGIGQMIKSVAFCIWYWTLDKKSVPSSAVLYSFKVTFKLNKRFSKNCHKSRWREIFLIKNMWLGTIWERWPAAHGLFCSTHQRQCYCTSSPTLIIPDITSTITATDITIALPTTCIIVTSTTTTFTEFTSSGPTRPSNFTGWSIKIHWSCVPCTARVFKSQPNNLSSCWWGIVTLRSASIT